MADQLGIHPRQVTIALGYVADHSDELEERIDANERALSRARIDDRVLDRAFEVQGLLADRGWGPPVLPCKTCVQRPVWLRTRGPFRWACRGKGPSQWSK